MSLGIVLGTSNPTKARYLAWLVEGLGLECLEVEGLESAPAETGKTLAENARLKAVHYSRISGSLAIASDGGLHIPALGERWDPLQTHRFAGEGVSEEQRARALLALMEGLRGEERRAFFVEAVALAYRGEVLGEWEAEGDEALVVERMPASLVGRPERLTPGFWADGLLAYGPEGQGGVERRWEGERPLRGTQGRLFAPTWAWRRLRPAVQGRLREWLG